jgi:GcrA cell cycle regulator
MIWRENQFAVWQQEREELLKELWPGPLTCEEIAERIGCSAKALAAKAYRLILPHRPGYRQRQPRNDHKWTEGQIEIVRSLWGKMSCREIADTLDCGLTKSSIIGKAHRLGLEKLKKGGNNSAGRGPDKTKRKHSKPLRPYNFGNGTWRPSIPMPPEAIEATTKFRCTFLQLNSNTCRWPIGDPGAPDFCFCGAPPQPEKPYCAAHCARAYDNTYRRPINAYKLMRVA